MTRTQVLSSPDEFRELRAEWSDLLSRSRSNTIFLTWEWLYSWWEVFGGDGNLFIVTLRNSNGDLVGIAPLQLKRSTYYSIPVRELSFIGTGLSDRQDIIISSSDNGAAAAITSVVHDHTKKWDIVCLEQVPEGSALVAVESNDRYRTEQEVSSFSPFVAIDGTWGGYIGSLSKKFRRDLRHKTNRMTRFGTWRYTLDERSEDTDALIGMMAAIEAKSRKEATEKAFFSQDGVQDFMIRFCRLVREKKWLDCSMITLNDLPIAYLFGFVYNRTYVAYTMAFVEDFHEASPGKLLLNEKLRWCFDHADDIDEFDFSRGLTYIKSLWTSEGLKHYRLVSFKKSLKSELMRLAIFRMRPLVRSLLGGVREH